MPSRNEFIAVMAKHLPPSASLLRLLDVGGVAGDVLSQLRGDLLIETASLNISQWDYPPESVDSVAAYDVLLKPEMLAAVLKIMRPGGRLIIVNPVGQVDESQVETLENAGYTRILVEPALHNEGVLLRGEKPHPVADTLERVQRVAQRDADTLNLDEYRGRYVHLLIRQSPNKPVWKLAADEPLTWQAAAVMKDNAPLLLAFSSLPKAVSFMQPAVMQDFIRDVNKVGKFSKETARTWTHTVLLNPTLEQVDALRVLMLDIDPTTAEAPDE